MNRFADNAGGFYVPWQNVINVTGKEFGGLEGIVDAHQVAHALLDQRFDFSQWGLYPACTHGDDYCQARQALIEGDAALTTDRWLEQSAAKPNTDALPQYQALPPAANDPAAPPFIVADVAFRNEYGRKFIEALYQRGGWATVNKAYEDLPVSTEQIMHPDQYLAGEKPIEVAAVPVPKAFGSDWQIIADETLGEWRTYQLLADDVDEAARLSDETAHRTPALAPHPPPGRAAPEAGQPAPWFSVPPAGLRDLPVDDRCRRRHGADHAHSGCPDLRRLAAQGHAGALGYFFAFAITPALCEELLFRGAIQGAYEKQRSPHVAIIVVALMFALWHMRVSRPGGPAARGPHPWLCGLVHRFGLRQHTGAFRAERDGFHQYAALLEPRQRAAIPGSGRRRGGTGGHRRAHLSHPAIRIGRRDSR